MLCQMLKMELKLIKNIIIILKLKINMVELQLYIKQLKVLFLKNNGIIIHKLEIINSKLYNITYKRKIFKFQMLGEHIIKMKKNVSSKQELDKYH